MSRLASVLSFTAVGLLALAACSLFVVMALTSWWWVAGSVLVVPIFVFVVLHAGSLLIPGLLFAAAMACAFAALVAAGDLVQDHHPQEPASRTFVQRVCGCSGLAVSQELIASGDRALDDVLRAFDLEAGIEATEAGAAAISVFASTLAYLPSDRIAGDPALRPCFPHATVVADDPYQAVVLGNERLIVVTFRGTDNAENWVRNFDATPAPTDLGRVHAGFLAGYRVLSPGVTKAVISMRDGGQSIWLTGHSLGGAMAVLAAPEFHQTFGGIERVVTFGQPPVGYPAYARAWTAMLPGRLVRYVNHRDAVVSVSGPMALPWASLTHMGEVRYFDTSGTLHANGVSTIQRLRDAVCAPSFESGAEFHAHYVRRYALLVMNAARG